ncbi:flavin reductase family protein [Corynebacterium sp. TAE3-ERU2]|uniref:flavin reductase family protein n=1 Tax=Corynebacterium sp. TAE3-ERU2 TaxID=2849497 RepID=UPI001C4853F3|nr:flavin reductase family protein [Corynebacterium sp. TAE3-ERU2]MBV7302335.1 flavin reductase family protein [Corynebacterium sp. TAE3-ERU2]
MSVATGVSIAAFKDSVGSFPSGVTVLSTHDDGADYAITISAFCSLSVDPPMVLVCIDTRSRTLAHMTPGARVGVSVLARKQSALALHFAHYGADRFETVPHRRVDDIPLVAGAASALVGTVEDWLDGGDHRILTIRVEDCTTNHGTTPLHYERGVLDGF